MEHEAYMRMALELAREASSEGEVPVGCVIADADGKVIGRGRNRREENADATAHAEIEAIREAGEALGSWRLDGCTLYVTLEPCPMSCGSVIDLFFERYGHQPKVLGGVLGEESAALLRAFFSSLR